jgi:hypothetical protein
MSLLPLGANGDFSSPTTFPEASESSIAYSSLKHQPGKIVFGHAAACSLICIDTMSTLLLLEVTQPPQQRRMILASLCDLLDAG